MCHHKVHGNQTWLLMPELRREVRHEIGDGAVVVCRTPPPVLTPALSHLRESSRAVAWMASEQRSHEGLLRACTGLGGGARQGLAPERCSDVRGNECTALHGEPQYMYS